MSVCEQIYRDSNNSVQQLLVMCIGLINSNGENDNSICYHIQVVRRQEIWYIKPLIDAIVVKTTKTDSKRCYLHDTQLQWLGSARRKIPQRPTSRPNAHSIRMRSCEGKKLQSSLVPDDTPLNGVALYLPLVYAASPKRQSPGAMKFSCSNL